MTRDVRHAGTAYAAAPAAAPRAAAPPPTASASEPAACEPPPSPPDAGEADALKAQRLEAYVARVRAALARRWKTRTKAAAKNTVAAIELDDAGRLVSFEIRSPSGDATFDDAVADTLRALVGTCLAAPPPGLDVAGKPIAVVFS